MIAQQFPALQVVVPLIAAPVCVILRDARVAWTIALVVTWAALGMALGGNFLSYSPLAHEPAHGQELGIMLVEIGVGMTVAAAMITIFFTYASQER